MHGEWKGLDLFPVGEQAGAFAGVGGDEEEGIFHRVNHVTASASALRAEQGE